MLKTVTFAPMPMASVTIAAVVNPGRFRKLRMACDKS
jgi:hypothetical protein